MKGIKKFREAVRRAMEVGSSASTTSDQATVSKTFNRSIVSTDLQINPLVHFPFRHPLILRHSSHISSLLVKWALKCLQASPPGQSAGESHVSRATSFPSKAFRHSENDINTFVNTPRHLLTGH